MRTRRRLFFRFACFIVIAGLLLEPVSAQQKTPAEQPTQGEAVDNFSHAEKIQQLVQPYLDHQKFQAVSIGVIANGKTWTGHFGELSPENKLAPNNQTLYEIGSATKVFTGLLLADAVNSGTVRLNQTLGDFFTGLSEANPEIADTITLQQLSNHVSGLPRMPTNLAPADVNDPFADYDRELLTEYLKTVTLTSPPGEKHEYSNFGVGLLGDLLAAKSEKNYGALLNEKILTPLNMSATGTDVGADRISQLAPPFNSALVADHVWHFDALAGAGAIRSNVDDMLKFMQANLSPPDNEIGRAIELAWKEYLPAGADHRAMGLGWMIALDGTTRWHNGQTGGYHSMMLVNRELNAAVILLSNTAAAGTDALAEGIFQTVVGMEVKPQKFEEEIKIAEAVIERLVGKYQLAPGVEIIVFNNKSRLLVQLTGQTALQVYPESETVWNYREVEAQLKFELPKTGVASKVTLFQNGMTLPAPRIEKK